MAEIRYHTKSENETKNDKVCAYQKIIYMYKRKIMKNMF